MVVLGYSRLQWLRFYPRQTMAVLMEALESALARFGGVPEELLFDQMRAVLFFQLINARHERASTVLTSNKGFENWGSVLGDEVMAAALIDRLVHHCHIVNIRGNPYRMRDHQNLMQAGLKRRRKRAAL